MRYCNCKGMKIVLGGTEFEFVKDFTYEDVIFIAAVLAQILITLNKETGVLEEDVMSYEPVVLFQTLKTLTNNNMSEFESVDGMYKLVDSYNAAFNEDSDVNDVSLTTLENILWEVCNMYRKYADELLRRNRDENSFGGQVRLFLNGMGGETGAKTMALMRYLLTEQAMAEIAPKKPAKEGIDLSDFKPREK